MSIHLFCSALFVLETHSNHATHTMIFVGESIASFSDTSPSPLYCAFHTHRTGISLISTLSPYWISLFLRCHHPEPFGWDDAKAGTGAVILQQTSSIPHLHMHLRVYASFPVSSLHASAARFMWLPTTSKICCSSSLSSCPVDHATSSVNDVLHCAYLHHCIYKVNAERLVGQSILTLHPHCRSQTV